MLADYMYTYNCGLFKITLSVMATHNAGGSMANQICVHPRTHEKKKENLQQKRGTILWKEDDEEEEEKTLWNTSESARERGQKHCNCNEKKLRKT